MTVNVKTLIISALAMATGASFGGVAYENLVLTTTDWFNATVGASSITTSTDSSWTTPTGYAWAYETVDSKTCAEINTDLNAPVTLTSSTVNSASGLTKMTFDLIASTVPNGVAVTAPDGKSPAYGFAIKADENGARNFYAYIGAAWVMLSGTVPDENTAYTLTVIEDARSGFGKVQFRVKIGDAAEVILAQDGTPATTWFDAGARKEAKDTVNVDLYGTGYFHQIDGDSQSVTAAEITTDGKKVVVTPEAAAAFEAKAGSAEAVATLMTTSLKDSGISGAPDSTSGNALKVRDAYVLGLISVSDNNLSVKDNGVIVMSKGTQPTTADATKIPLALNVTPPDGAATVTFTLLGRDTDSDDWTTVQSGKSATELGIPLKDEQSKDVKVYNYYKVQANITYATTTK